MTTLESMRFWISTKPENEDGTVLVGKPEIENLANHCWCSKAAISRIVNRIARTHDLPKFKAIDGVMGYRIRREWF